MEAPLLLREGWNITCRGIAAFVPDGRQLGAVEECDGGVLALLGVPVLGPEGEFAFLEYVEKAYRETQMGLSSWPSPPELSSACGRACRRGRNCQSAAETSGRRTSSLSAHGRDTVPAKSVLEHLVCPSASAPGRGTMPAKASPGASRVSVRERPGRRACQQSCLACPPASSGLAETGARVLRLDTGLVDALWEKGPYALQSCRSWRRGSLRRRQKRAVGRLPSEVAWRDVKFASLLKNSSVSARSRVEGWEEHRRDCESPFRHWKDD